MIITFDVDVQKSNFVICIIKLSLLISKIIASNIFPKSLQVTFGHTNLCGTHAYFVAIQQLCFQVTLLLRSFPNNYCFL